MGLQISQFAKNFADEYAVEKSKYINKIISIKILIKISQLEVVIVNRLMKNRAVTDIYIFCMRDFSLILNILRFIIDLHFLTTKFYPSRSKNIYFHENGHQRSREMALQMSQFAKNFADGCAPGKSKYINDEQGLILATRTWRIVTPPLPMRTDDTYRLINGSHS